METVTLSLENKKAKQKLKKNRTESFTSRFLVKQTEINNQKLF